MSPSHNILDLGLSDFNETWELQKKLQTKRILNEIEDHLLLVEHPPVYTLGKNAPKEHLLNFVNDASVIQTDRGGNITFHGPGQLVGYPILDLNLRLGEGSGAAIASLIIKSALVTHNGMSTFSEAGVSEKS